MHRAPIRSGPAYRLLSAGEVNSAHRLLASVHRHDRIGDTHAGEATGLAPTLITAHGLDHLFAVWVDRKRTQRGHHDGRSLRRQEGSALRPSHYLKALSKVGNGSVSLLHPPVMEPRDKENK